MYGGMGMGYGYSNGLLTGMILGNMMHPMNTVIYTGGGGYNNNALLYPDGRVVNQHGYVVGTYINGQFSPISNGELVGQPVPQDARQSGEMDDIVLVIVLILILTICFFIFVALF